MPGQLDWDVAQGPGLWRKLELKRGKNKLSENQLTTFRKLNECGMMPVLAYDLQQAWRGLAAVGFRFTGNVSTLLQKYEAQLEALDRAAEADQPAKLRRAPKKQGPRAARPGKWYRKANAQGLI
jgi:hypothetical protein